MRTMVCISGEEAGLPVLNFGTWFADKVSTNVTVLYVEKEPALFFQKETDVALEKLLEWNLDLPAIRIIRMTMKWLMEINLLKKVKGQPKIRHDFIFDRGGWELHLESREGRHIRLRTRQGNIVEQIIAENRNRHHDLVIFGESRRSKLLPKALFFLDSSVMVLNNLIDHPYEVLLATDGSEMAHKAEYVGIKTAQYFHRKLILLSVVNDPERRDAIDKHLKRMSDIIKKRGVKHSVEICSGDIVQNIIDVAGNNKMIFLGASGRSALSKYLFGSKTLKICRKSQAPVFVVKKHGGAS